MNIFSSIECYKEHYHKIMYQLTKVIPDVDLLLKLEPQVSGVVEAALSPDLP
jgi:hypothetical protein